MSNLINAKIATTPRLASPSPTRSQRQPFGTGEDHNPRDPAVEDPGLVVASTFRDWRGSLRRVRHDSLHLHTSGGISSPGLVRIATSRPTTLLSSTSRSVRSSGLASPSGLARIATRTARRSDGGCPAASALPDWRGPQSQGVRVGVDDRHAVLAFRGWRGSQQHQHAVVLGMGGAASALWGWRGSQRRTQ